MLQNRTLDVLYEVYGTKVGWLSYLSEVLMLQPQELEYLSWRDDSQALVDNKMAEWDYEIESYGGLEIYNEESPARQFVMLTELINSVEKSIDPELLNRLIGTRYHLKNALLKKAAPSLGFDITDSDIDRARSYPLWRLMGLPRQKNILCPYHKEKSPSFNAGKWGYCFTCKTYVDSIGYIMANRSLTFSEAVKDLANR